MEETQFEMMVTHPSTGLGKRRLTRELKNREQKNREQNTLEMYTSNLLSPPHGLHILALYDTFIMYRIIIKSLSPFRV